MNGQQLKNSILQLAIQGRLVPQDSKDEPASALLARIREEKQRLVKEKKIKKEKPLAPITDDEKPFDIPDSWEWVRLGEITYNNGQKKPNNRFSYIDIGSINNSRQLLNTEEKILNANEAPSRARKIVKYGDILYSTVRPYLHNMCIINKDFSEEPIASTGFAVISCTQSLFNQFLFNFLRSPVFDEYANHGDNAKGIAYPAISDTKMNLALIPLPPLVEQHRIVEKIEELLPLVEEYDEAQKKLDKLNDELPEMLKKSVLQQAVMGKLDTRNDDDEPASVLLKRIKEEKAKLIKEKKIKKEKPLAPITDDEKPFDIPESWEWVRIIDIANSQLGKTLDRGKDSGEEYPYLCSINIYWDGIDLNNVKYFKLQENEKEKYRVEKNDLLVCEGGEVARCCVWDFEMEIYYQNALHRIRFYQKINPYFYKYVIQVYKALGIIKGRGQTILHFTYTEMKKLCFPLPPLAEQHRIVEKIEELLPLIDEMKKT